MSWSVIQKPGSEFGPCEDECEHLDCKASRDMAETICRFCDEPIGYDRGLTREPEDERFVHSSCLFEAYR